MAPKTEKKLFKDEIDQKAIQTLGHFLHSAWPKFPLDDFVADGMTGLQKMELKTRVRHLIEVMNQHLPTPYPEALEVVTKAGIQWKNEKSERLMDGFAAWPLIDWVGEHGLEYPTESLAALRQITELFSAEFSIRPFLLQDPVNSISELHSWCSDKNHHVRRLVSEGTRPRLPWGQQLPMFMANPQPTLELLETLKDDESEYVRRSVANHLNDVAKDHPDLVAEIGKKWMKDASVQRQRLVKHGLRTLVKKGHSGALEALGFETNPEVDVSFALGAKSLCLGESLVFESEIVSKTDRPQKLVIDFVVHYRKANGSLSGKVFKWKDLQLAPGEKALLKKKQTFVSRSVRKLYPGEHFLEIQISGVSFGKLGFVLNEI